MRDLRVHRRLLWVVAAVVVMAVMSSIAVREFHARRARRGAELAVRFCGACHPVPGPDLLAKDEWEYVLAKMGFLLGKDTRRDVTDPVRRENLDGAYRFLASGGFVSSTPAMTDADWAALREHYLERAPPALHPRAGHPLPSSKTKFTVIPNGYAAPGSIISLVKIDEARKVAPPARHQCFTSCHGFRLMRWRIYCKWYASGCCATSAAGA